MKIFYDSDKQSTFKKKAYICFSELLKVQKHNNYLYRFGIALETLQLSWYSIAPKFVHNTAAKQWLEETLYSIQIDNALDSNKKSVILSLLYIAFGWKMLCLLAAFIGGSSLLKPNALKSRGQRAAVVFWFWSMMLMGFLLTLPIFHIYLSVLICIDENQVRRELVCYKGIYFVHFFAALLGIAMQLGFTILGIIYCCDLNPFSPAPHATTQNRPLLYRLYKKLLLPLFLVLTTKYKSLSFIVYIYAVLWLGKLVYRYRQTMDFNKSNYFFKVASEVLILWVTVYELVRLGIDEKSKDASISVIFFLCCPVLVYGVNQIIQQRHNEFKIKHIKDFIKDTEVEIYLGILIDLIKKRKHPKQWMELEGIVNHHVRQCTITTCQCLQLSRNEEGLSPEEDEKLWYSWVQNLVENALEKFPKSGKLHLLSAFIHYVKLKNTFKALHELEITILLNRRAEEDFAAFYYKVLIEHEIIENDQREKEAQGNEFSRIMAFHEGFTELEGLLSEAISHYIEFWSELLESSPHIRRLYNFGAEVVDSTDKIMEKYADLIAINPSHMRLHQAYGDYTKIVIPDSNESTKAFEKMDNETTTLITKHQMDTHELRYIEEDQERFIIISGSHKTMGIMTDIGARVTEKLGYTKAELLNRNVSVLMPKVFAEVHDRLLETYLLNTSNRSHDPHRNKIVFPCDKTGYLVPCNVVVYILPSLREGIRLAGFLRELEEFRDDFGDEESAKKAACYLIINTDTQLIQGVSRSCWDYFGISCNFVEGNEGAGDVGVTDLFGEFSALDMTKLKSDEGIETSIDTTKLSQYHFISEQELRGEDGESENNEEESSREPPITRFREARVTLRMVLEADYFGNRVQVLKFTEVIQEGETQRVKSPKILKRHEMFQQNTTNRFQADTSPKDRRSAADSEEDDADGIGEGSVGTVNEELKILKEIRLLFSNKKSSRAMRVLMVVYAMFFLLLIGLASFQLSMTNKQINEFSDTINFTMVAYSRYRSLADLVTITRQYQYLIFTGQVMPPTSVTYYQNLAASMMKNISDALSNLQFSIIEASLNLEGSSFNSADTKKFTFELFVDSGIVLQRKIYLDGYFQFMTAVDQVRNSSLASLVSPQSNVDPGLKSFRYAIRNGFGPLREGAEMMIDNLDLYHKERREHYEKTFQTILIISEVIIVIAAIVSIPFIFAALQTKDKIISLFGYMPMSQIESMVENGERYREEYLKSYIDAGAMYDEEGSLENSRNNIKTVYASQEHEIGSPDESRVRSAVDESEDPDTVNIDEGIRSPTQLMSPLTLGTQMPLPTIGYRQTTMDAASPRDPMLMMSSARLLSTQNHQLQSTERNLMTNSNRFSSNQNGEESKRKSLFISGGGEGQGAVIVHHHHYQNEEMIHDNKIPKKIRTERGNRRLVVLGVSLGTLFWIWMFISVYVFFERDFLKKEKQVYDHLILNMGRSSYLSYLNGFISEEIANVNSTAIYDYPGHSKFVDQRLRFRKLLEEANSHVLDPEMLDLPKAFSDYLATYVEISTGNMCPYYSSIESERANCEQFANGLITKGLRMVILTDALLGDSLISDYQAKLSQIDKTNSTQVKSTMTSTILSADYAKIARITKYLMPVAQLLRGMVVEAKDSFFQDSKVSGTTQFIIILVLALAMYAILWYQSSRGLGNRIVKSKRMLTMIPMEFVVNNEIFKERVLSRDIHQVLA